MIVPATSGKRKLALREEIKSNQRKKPCGASTCIKPRDAVSEYLGKDRTALDNNASAFHDNGIVIQFSCAEYFWKAIIEMYHGCSVDYERMNV